MNTGGPAFPVPVSDATDGRTHDGGMTLLDWMAGQALVGSLASQSKESHWAFATVEYETADNMATKGIAALCYDLAEAMLAEKARREATVKPDLKVQDHSGDANKMAEDHFRGVTEMTNLESQNRELVERQNAQLRSLLRQAELAIAFANRDPNVIRMLGDDYTEVLQLIRAVLKEAKP